MKRAFLLIAAIIMNCTIVFAQKWIPETICSSDTFIVEPSYRMYVNNEKINSTNQLPYKIVQCRTRSNIGVRFEIAVSNYYYGEKTTNWLGQHGGPNFNLAFAIDQFNLGLRFKPWTVAPQKELNFNGQILPTSASLNPVKIDFYLGYSIDFEKLISIEPYLGFNRSSFVVINENELNQKYSFKKTGGPIVGTTFNKYIRIKEYNYLSIFGTVGYGFVNFEKVNAELDNGYFEWNLGLASKGFFTKIFSKKVE